MVEILGACGNEVVEVGTRGGVVWGGVGDADLFWRHSWQLGLLLAPGVPLQVFD